MGIHSKYPLAAPADKGLLRQPAGRSPKPLPAGQRHLQEVLNSNELFQSSMTLMVERINYQICRGGVIESV